MTLCEVARARFPDAVTERGRRHLEHLVARVREGERAVLLFVAQRADAESVAPADDIDPAYGAALRAAVAAGVEVHALGPSSEPDGALPRARAARPAMKAGDGEAFEAQAGA